MVAISQLAIDEVRQMSMAEDDCPLECNYFGRQVIEAAQEYLKQQSDKAAEPIPLLTRFERREDMGRGRLQFLLDGDADVIVTVIDNEGQASSVEFCTAIMGGGRSPNVRDALINVMKAIREENLTNPLPQ
ncbi:hypothetical protein [Pseudomonas baetica]|uniref:hypothetical protein n=1 Tax=Pseudomonas baetica TaxID=674054 RepID=UPI00240680FF|nr:hypothetical protein [Pseudomonas baetica]MDF9779081.1 hypothetical protein [Pseudomonas baetica]